MTRRRLRKEDGREDSDGRRSKVDEASTKGAEEVERTEPAVLLHSISQLVTMDGGGPGARRGRQMREIGLIEDAAVLIAGGRIVEVGKYARGAAQWMAA